MRQSLLILFSTLGILQHAINLNAQSCFPVNSYWEGRFFSFTGQGDWHMTFGVDKQFGGLTCQPANFSQLQDPPMSFQYDAVYYYHNDGTYLYYVDTQTLDLNPLYPIHPSPNDTLLNPLEWEGFGQEFHRWVLDTFTMKLVEQDYFAYRMVNQCKLEVDDFYDTITVVPALGMFPWFGHERPHLNIPNCSLFDGTRYNLACAKIPGIGLYGDSTICAHLVSIKSFIPSEDIRIRTNPVQDLLYLVGVENGTISTARVLDLSGRVILSMYMWPIGVGMPVHTLPVGAYCLELIMQDGKRKSLLFLR